MVSPLVSPSPLTRPATATDSTGNLTRTTSTGTTVTWTSDQEVRLAYCQDQLKQAQKKWSDRQELWIREVDHLLEQKRLHLKSQKPSKEPSLRLWKRTRSWKAPSRPPSAVDTTDGERERDEGEEEEEDDDGLALRKGGGRGPGVRRSESMPQAVLPSHSTSFPPPSSAPNRNPFKKIIRRMSTATGGGGGGRRHSDSVAGAAAREVL